MSTSCNYAASLVNVSGHETTNISSNKVLCIIVTFVYYSVGYTQVHSPAELIELISIRLPAFLERMPVGLVGPQPQPKPNKHQLPLHSLYSLQGATLPIIFLNFSSQHHPLHFLSFRLPHSKVIALPLGLSLFALTISPLLSRFTLNPYVNAHNRTMSCGLCRRSNAWRSELQCSYTLSLSHTHTHTHKHAISTGLHRCSNAWR